MSAAASRTDASPQRSLSHFKALSARGMGDMQESASTHYVPPALFDRSREKKCMSRAETFRERPGPAENLVKSADTTPKKTGEPAPKRGRFEKDIEEPPKGVHNPFRLPKKSILKQPGQARIFTYAGSFGGGVTTPWSGKKDGTCNSSTSSSSPFTISPPTGIAKAEDVHKREQQAPFLLSSKTPSISNSDSSGSPHAPNSPPDAKDVKPLLAFGSRPSLRPARPAGSLDGSPSSSDSTSPLSSIHSNSGFVKSEGIPEALKPEESKSVLPMPLTQPVERRSNGTPSKWMGTPAALEPEKSKSVLPMSLNQAVERRSNGSPSKSMGTPVVLKSEESKAVPMPLNQAVEKRSNRSPRKLMGTPVVLEPEESKPVLPMPSNQAVEKRSNRSPRKLMGTKVVLKPEESKPVLPMPSNQAVERRSNGSPSKSMGTPVVLKPEESKPVLPMPSMQAVERRSNGSPSKSIGTPAALNEVKPVLELPSEQPLIEEEQPDEKPVLPAVKKEAVVKSQSTSPASARYSHSSGASSAASAPASLAFSPHASVASSSHASVASSSPASMASSSHAPVASNSSHSMESTIASVASHSAPAQKQNNQRAAEIDHAVNQVWGPTETATHIKCSICAQWYEKANKQRIRYHVLFHCPMKQFECIFAPDCTYAHHEIGKIKRHVQSVHKRRIYLLEKSGVHPEQSKCYESDLLKAAHDSYMKKCFPNYDTGKLSIGRTVNYPRQLVADLGCSLCDRKTTRELCAFHIVDRHATASEFSCHICPYRSLFKRQLSIHYQACHRMDCPVGITPTTLDYRYDNIYTLKSFFPELIDVNDPKCELELMMMDREEKRGADCREDHTYKPMFAHQEGLDRLLAFNITPEDGRDARCTACMQLRGRSYVASTMFHALHHTWNHMGSIANQWLCPFEGCSRRTGSMIEAERHIFKWHDKHSQERPINLAHKLNNARRKCFAHLFPGLIRDYPQFLIDAIQPDLRKPEYVVELDMGD